MKKSEKKCYESTGTKFLAHKMSQYNIGNWQLVVQVQYYMLMLEVEDHHLATSDASDTMNF